MRRSISTLVVCSVGCLALVGPAVAEDEELVKLGAQAAAAGAADAQAAENEQVATGETGSEKADGEKADGEKADGKDGKEKEQHTHVVKATNGLNLRDKPTIKDSKVLVNLPNGTPVKVLDKAKHPWWRASAKGQTGYLWHGYLKGPGGGAQGEAGGENKGSQQGSGNRSSGGGNSATNGTNSGASSGGGGGGNSGGGAPAGGRAGDPNDSGTVDTRNLSGLNPDFRAKVERILRRLKSLGWQPRVAEGRRTLAQQREKVRKGYSKTMNSRHLTGNAADIIDSRYAWNIPTSHKFWNDLGAAAAAEGLTWGGNWKSFKDVAHVQQ